MKFLIILLIFISSGAHASVQKPGSIEIQNALRLPLESRLNFFNKSGDATASAEQLKQIAFDPNETLQNRWRAITVMGRAYPKTARSHIELALVSPDWFMRNAALIVLPYGDKKWAKKWSIQLLDDSALVVRTAAVKVIRQLDAQEAAPILWKKLYSTENYRGQQSLWIRRHIMGAIKQFAKKGDEKQLIAVLNDGDKDLHPLAVQALKRVTKQSFETKTQWAQWWTTSKKI